MLIVNSNNSTRKKKPRKRILTTGEIAKYCGVNFRTVIRWVDRGHLKAFLLPGRGDRRIEIKEFLRFLNHNKMTVPEEFQMVPPNLLIVDNEKHVANAIKRVLRKTGLKTTIALDGFHAGILLKSLRPAVMTLDIKMPGCSGLEVLKVIRRSGEIGSTKVLVVSGDAADRLKEAARLGADDVLGKPFSNEDLLKKVTRLLSKWEEETQQSK